MKGAARHAGCRRTRCARLRGPIMSSASSDHLIGQRLEERYVLEQLVGHGGMSKIYKALDLRLHRTVAVKILNENYAAQPEVRKRFASEAVIAANLSHPNVLRVLDHNVSGQLVYLVMEYVQGQNLHELINARGRLTPRQTLSLLEKICRGLAAAHTEEIVHRDIKPANVLISSRGQVHIADFGLARAASAHTQSLTLWATLHYASPELVSGQPADARSDIYAVGVMIYQMLTGTLPYPDASLPALMNHQLNSETPLPSALVPHLAQDLDELVRFCTEKDPENRPQNASFLLDEIIQIQATLSAAQLDLGSEQFGGLQDLIPHDSPAPTSVQQRLGQWEAAERHGAPDHWRVENPGSEATAVLNPSDHPTEAIDAAGAPTQALNQAPTQAYAANAPQPAPPTAQPFTPQPTELLGRSEESEQPEQPERPAQPSKREQLRAQKKWRKEAQIPTHRLAKPLSAGRRLLTTVLIILSVALVASAAWFFGRGPGSIVNIPSLSGMLQAQAVEQLEHEGVPVRVNNSYHDEVAVGRVIDSNPGQGQNIMRFQGVELVISRGPQSFTMPDVTGLSSNAASTKLEELELRTPEVSEDYSATVPQGHVISSTPLGGAQLTRKSGTSLLVSAGPAPVQVPQLIGMKRNQARAALEEIGLRLEVGEAVYSSQVPADQVAAQNPDEGTVPAGSTISVQLSQGPEYLSIPSVIGQRQQDAVQTLEEAGFTVEIRKMLGERSATVRMQTPLNQQAARGSEITIYLF